jgi:predicted ATPase
MVTLTGPGGTGKTRLALQVGSTLLHDFRDGVFFVNLAPLTDPALVPSSIAEVLDVTGEPGKDLVATLADSLRNQHLLLVLDNLEHLLAAASVISSLLDDCRELHLLVTSRIPLHLAREHEHAVPPLSLPDPRSLPDPASLSQYEAVGLFIERARAAKDSFAVTNENAPAVAEICRRLDGLPLAIVLAAARIKLFPPRALLQRLSNRLKLLTGGAKDRPTRQQTLRGAIDWSYSLLTEEEQLLFARLSVLGGSGLGRPQHALPVSISACSP